MRGGWRGDMGGGRKVRMRIQRNSLLIITVREVETDMAGEKD